MRTKNLAPGVARYLFVEHTVEPGPTDETTRHHPRDQRSFLVLRGTAELSTSGAAARRFGPGTGWHAPPGVTYRIGAAGDEPAVLIEAGTVRGPDAPPRPAASAPGTSAPGTSAPAADDLPELSTYTVDKPWGSEIWYTRNLTEPQYALKRITMTAGHRSSLQSHQHKAETNYVIDGQATVLSGVPAPADPRTPVDQETLTVTVHDPGTGWSSPPGELHRVIAHHDYTAIEVSTPELDDVIRWRDDTGRGHGRVATEHQGVRP